MTDHQGCKQDFFFGRRSVEDFDEILDVFKERNHRILNGFLYIIMFHAIEFTAPEATNSL